MLKLLIFGLCELRPTVEKQTCQGINILVFVASFIFTRKNYLIQISERLDS